MFGKTDCLKRLNDVLQDLYTRDSLQIHLDDPSKVCLVQFDVCLVPFESYDFSKIMRERGSHTLTPILGEA
jgi:hypothetical protein